MPARRPRPLPSAFGLACLALLAPALPALLAGCGESDRSGVLPYVEPTEAERAAIDAEENG